MNRKIFCFGDSNTYGFDPRSYLGGRYPRAIRWTGWLAELGWEVINEGQNGRSILQSEGEIATLAQELCRIRPEILTVMLGSNDLLQSPGLFAEECARRMERFLSSLLRQAPPSMKTLLIAPPPMQLGAWVTDPRTLTESRRLSGCYAQIAETLGIAFANAAPWNVQLTFDGIHFSEEGHRIFAERILKMLNTWLKTSRKSQL